MGMRVSLPMAEHAGDLLGITRQAVRCGATRSVKELTAAVSALTDA